VLYCVTPCVLIKSFVEIPFSAQKVKELFLSLLIAVLIHVGFILLCYPLVRDADDSRERMLRFCIIFSNAGCMGLPLQEAILGEEGTFFGGAYVAVFNVVVWSFGLLLMSGNRKTLSVKKMFLTPGILGVLIGLILFILPQLIRGFALPTLVFTPIKHLANLNTPLPMIIIGYYLANTDLKASLRDIKSFYVIFLRNAALPLVALGVMYLCGVRGTMLISLAISACAPTAALSTMFAAKYDRYPGTSCNIVSLSTLFSVLTMPLIVGLASMLA
ncbi:MAG: AEC family transporter, partial [Clostridia bacterium]|nr:AEC family transporter [Clostridia bacterium]